MPLWTIHHTPGTFSVEDKRALASDITAHYERVGLPRFYVVVLFRESVPDDFYVGGEPAPVGVRIAVDHIARRGADRQSRQRIVGWINQMLAPHVERIPGLHWELHIDETSEELWLINGLVPPPAGSEEEKRWAKDNAVSAY
ncbi:tautomerase family protein [Mycobacterium sp. CSUR Q5927]|nr:tautomerase family protein [Mycobacterium sp. CSUR Q5927]